MWFQCVIIPLSQLLSVSVSAKIYPRITYMQYLTHHFIILLASAYYIAVSVSDLQQDMWD